MTNKEAIEYLEEIIVLDDSIYQYNPIYLEALNKAIKALEELPKRRKAVKRWKMKALEKRFDDHISNTTLKEHLNEGSEDAVKMSMQNSSPEERKVMFDQMRDCTPEEQESVYEYIHSISKPTGINVFDFYEDEEREQLDFIQEHKSIPCTIKVKNVSDNNVGNITYIKLNDIIKMLNTMDRYKADKLILQDTDKEFPRNEVYVVDDVFEELEKLPSVDIPSYEGMTNAEVFIQVFGTKLYREYITTSWWEQKYKRRE